MPQMKLSIAKVSTESKQDRPAAETVGQVSEERREQELHAGIDEHQPAAVDRRIADGAAGQLLQIGGQHRHDDGDADHIQEEDDEDQEQAAANEFRIKHEASLQRVGFWKDDLVAGEVT